MTATNSIYLSRKNGSWMAHFSGPHAHEVVKAFGTAAIPTAYSDAAPADRVKREIEALNPGVGVHVVV